MLRRCGCGLRPDAGRRRYVRNPYEVEHFEECPAHEDRDGHAGACECDEIGLAFEEMAAEMWFDLSREEGL